MRTRGWMPAVFLAAPVLIVVSLSMPWVTASCGGAGAGYLPGAPAGSSAGLPNLGACFFIGADGWTSVGYAAALASVALAALLAWQLVTRTALRGGVAVGAALLPAYLTVGVVADALVRAQNERRGLERSGGAVEGVHLHLAHGAYVGLAGAALALVGAAVPARPSRRSVPSIVFALGLLVALLLPWQGSEAAPGLSLLGVSTSPGIVAAALAIAVVVGPAPGVRLAAALGSALFVGAAAADVGFGADRRYGAWLGMALVVLLVAASMIDPRRGRLLPRRDLTPAVVASAFVASLFLPWQHACYDRDPRFGALAGRCASGDAFGLVGSTAALAALLFAGFALLSVSRFVSRRELAAAVALLTATLGLLLQSGSEAGIHSSFGYGSYVGFACAAALAAAALAAEPRLPPMPRTALAPVVLALAYVAAVALPWWNVLPDGVWADFDRGLASASWLTVASALLGLRLVRLWWRPVAGAPELVAVSLALVALTVLETLPLPTLRATWNLGVLLALVVPLALLALVEARGGLRTLTVPEILRIDRIS